MAERRYSALSFLTRHLATYKQIWKVLGWEWLGLPLAAARASTIGSGKQREFGPDFTLSDTQRQQLLWPLRELGWYKGVQLEPRFYNDLLMQGMGYRGMVAMVEMVFAALKDNSRLDFGRLYALGGQRARSDKTDGTVEEIYASLKAGVCDNPWVIEQMALMREPDSHLPYKGAFATEYELFILAILVALDGKASVRTGEPVTDDVATPPDNIPVRMVSSTHVVPQGGRYITVVNAPAQQRGRGLARATSRGNAEYWVRRYATNGHTVAITGSRVGARRVLATSEEIIHRVNPTLSVHGFIAPPPTAKDEHFVALLSETANMLLKAFEEYLNLLLPAGAEALTSRDVKLLLERLLTDPCAEMVALVLREVCTNDVVRAEQ